MYSSTTPQPLNSSQGQGPAPENLKLSCVGCQMWFVVPLELAGRDCRCPGCGRKNYVPSAASPLAETRMTATSLSFRHDPRLSDQWSVSLSDNRLPDPEGAVPATPTPQPEQAASSLLVATPVGAVAAPVVPPAPTGPETVEELLAGVQYTVVEASEARQWGLQLAALAVILGICALIGPGLLHQGKKLVTPRPPPPPPVVMSASSKKPVVASTDYQTPKVTNVSTTGRGPWKPFQQKPVTPSRPSMSSASPPAPARNFGSAPGSSPPAAAQAAAPRYQYVENRIAAPAQAAPVTPPWASPVRRETRSISSSPPAQQVITSFAPDIVAPPSAPTIITSAASSEDLAVGFYQKGDDQEQNPFAASLDALSDLPESAPEWMKLPTRRWPIIMVANEGSFRGHSSAEGTNGVLIEGKADQLWLATSVQSLRNAGGVEPPLKPEDVRRKLVRWQGIHPSDASQVVEIRNGSDFTIGNKAGAFVMNVNSRQSLLGVKPLKLRTEAVSNGDTLYLVVLPAQEMSSQLVYHTTVTDASATSEFEVAISGRLDASAFFGAALIDRDGRLAGVVATGDQRGHCFAAPSTALAGFVD